MALFPQSLKVSLWHLDIDLVRLPIGAIHWQGIEAKSCSMANEFEWTAPSVSQDSHPQHCFWGQLSQVRHCLLKPEGNALCTAGWR